MELVGTASGFFDLDVTVRVGEGNGFFPGLPRSGGQIQDIGGSPDGSIDFPANSIFDVFFDVWIDLNGNNVPDLFEVMRNFEGAVRLVNDSLTDAPPKPLIDAYTGQQVVDMLDPNVGMLNATMLTPLPVDLNVVLQDGTQDSLVAATC